MRGLGGFGASVAALISYAVEHRLKDGKVSEAELFELLSDYLGSPKFKEKSIECNFGGDGYREFLADKDMEALWGLVPNVPESLSHVIIEHLPASAVWRDVIPQHVLDGMSNRQLVTLLSCPHNDLRERRKRVFFEIINNNIYFDNKINVHLLTAAISYAFDFTNEEFAKVLAIPGGLRERVLNDLVTSAHGLRPCLYKAIYDVLVSFNPDQFGVAHHETQHAKRVYESKLEDLKSGEDNYAVTDLRLYELAARSVPWKKGQEAQYPAKEVAFLKEAVVEGDTWATFMAFSKTWGAQPYFQAKSLERFLPSVCGASEGSRPDPDLAQQKVLEGLAALKAEIVNTKLMQRVSLWLIVALLVGTLLAKL